MIFNTFTQNSLQDPKRTFWHLVCRYLEFGPILVFGGLESVQGIDTPTRFLIGGGLAGIVLLGGTLLKKRANSLALSADLFLLLGSAAWVLKFAPLMLVMQNLKESSLFLIMLGVGLYRTLASPGGFIDLRLENTLIQKRRSSILLAAVLAALGLSVAFSGREWLSAALPFGAILLLQGYLRCPQARASASKSQKIIRKHPES